MVRRMEPALAVILTTVLLGFFLAAPSEMMAQAVPGRMVSSSSSQGLLAMDTAARNGKYLFIFFWKDNDEQNRSMYGVFQSATGKMAQRADSIGIRIADPREKPLVDKFGLERAPMPLVLAVAPNGAVTKGFAVSFTEQQLREAFVSPCTARCMKALQDRKLVLLCVQNQSTQFSQAALKAVEDFKADTRFANATEIVTLNPDDRTEAAFLRDLQVDPQSPQATTVLLAPPGQPLARFAGAVTKDQLVAKLLAAQSSCCPGGKCGPGGCGPRR